MDILVIHLTVNRMEIIGVNTIQVKLISKLFIYECKRNIVEIIIESSDTFSK